MARGTQFSAIINRVKNETGRSDEVSIGIADLPRVKEAINTVYHALYLNHDWDHLRKVFARQTLSAGQRYYDFPAGLNLERIEHVEVWYSDIPHSVERGIGFEDYAVYDSENDERNEPALKWDIKWTGSSEQIEIWPVPSTNNQELQIIGLQDAPRLVNDDDLCLLDDTLVVLYAAAHLLDGDEAKMKLDFARAHLATLQSRHKSTGKRYRLGVPTDDAAVSKRSGIVIRVS